MNINQKVKLIEQIKNIENIKNVPSFPKIITEENSNGELKKKFIGLPKNHISNTDYTHDCFFIKTGKESGVMVIDIDDIDEPHNLDIIMILSNNCNMITKTPLKGGYHYWFKSNPLYKNTASKEYKLDIRNEGGIIICPPTTFINSKTDEILNYEFEIMPEDTNELLEVPAELTKYLKNKFGSFYIENSNVNINQNNTDTKINDVETKRKIDISFNIIERELLLKVLDNLKIGRFINYNDWFIFGSICYNDPNLTKEDFINYSKKPAYYENDTEGQEKAWLSYKDNYHKIKTTSSTLWKWLKEDNYTIFQELISQSKSIWEFIETLNDNYCANYFYNLNPDIYKYDNEHGWYYLNEYNVWKNSGFKKPVNMSKQISNCFQNMIIEYKQSESFHINKIKKSNKTDDEKNQYEKKYNDRIKLLNRQFVKCGSFSFTNDVFNFLSSLYNVENILNLFDKNVNLFAFDDKVYVKNENIIRDIKPNDYICLTTGYKYPINSDINVRKQIFNTIYSMFDDDKMTEYILYVFASAILGNNKFEKFYILTGLGGNGKGLISDIINQAFGNYFINVSNTIFTQKSKNKDTPLNEIVDSRYKRIMMTTEPENNETLLVGMIKKYTGGDIVQARNCFNKYVHNFKPPYILFLQCNTIPKLSAIDKGIERRLTIINFPFQFKSIPNPLNSNERQADCNIKKLFNENELFRNEMILILLEYVSKLDKMTSNEFAKLTPEPVLQKTREFINENNFLKEWIENNIIITNNINDKLAMRECYKAYKDSIIDEVNSFVLNERRFKENMIYNGIAIKDIQGKGLQYCGIKLKTSILIEDSE